MKIEMLVATVLIEQPLKVVWEYWIDPEAIKVWNTPSDNWVCPIAENDVQTCGSFFLRMESKDGKDGFDYKGIYTEVIPLEYIATLQSDGRSSIIEFQQIDNNTVLRETFEPDKSTPLDVQKKFCQSVLEKFKEYVESKDSKNEKSNSRH